ncbi:aminoglycoside phosphotransferase family protein [Mastigocladus laminosus UU774]|nr:aminoglycoside phosphotransferase family protein [Mastigocladus laminosus UU774]
MASFYQKNPESTSFFIRAARFGLINPAFTAVHSNLQVWPWVLADNEEQLIHKALARAGIRESLRAEKIVRFSARRPVFLITTNGESLLLKWLDPLPGLGSDNEIFILRLLEGLVLPLSLRTALPQIVGYDPEQRLLVLEGAAGFKTLREMDLSGMELSPTVLTTLATVLATLHNMDVRTLRQKHPDRRLFLPIESMMDISPRELVSGPGIHYGLFVETVQSVDAELRLLSEQWQPDSLIHFDVRDDNILIAGSKSNQDCPIRLVDWELAGFGDPLYDVGTVLGQLVYHALRKIGSTDREFVIPKWAISTFVEVYTRMIPHPPSDLQSQVMRYAGVFLLLRALATLQVVGVLGPAGKLSLLLGRRFLQSPDTSMKLLYQ